MVHCKITSACFCRHSDSFYRYDRLRGLTPRTRFITIDDTCTRPPRRAGSAAHTPHASCRFLEYLRADGVFLPATVADPPVHGDVEGEELDWEDCNAQSRTGISSDNSLIFDLTDVQTAIGSVSDSL